MAAKLEIRPVAFMEFLLTGITHVERRRLGELLTDQLRALVVGHLVENKGYFISHLDAGGYQALVYCRTMPPFIIPDIVKQVNVYMDDVTKRIMLQRLPIQQTAENSDPVTDQASLLVEINGKHLIKLTNVSEYIEMTFLAARGAEWTLGHFDEFAAYLNKEKRQVRFFGDSPKPDKS